MPDFIEDDHLVQQEFYTTEEWDVKREELAKAKAGYEMDIDEDDHLV